MIPLAFLILALAVLLRLLPELRHVDAIEAAWTPEERVATLAGDRALSSGVRASSLSHSPDARL